MYLISISVLFHIGLLFKCLFFFNDSVILHYTETQYSETFERRIYRYRHLFNIQYLLIKFKECVNPLSDVPVKGLLHLFIYGCIPPVVFLSLHSSSVLLILLISKREPLRPWAWALSELAIH